MRLFALLLVLANAVSSQPSRRMSPVRLMLAQVSGAASPSIPLEALADSVVAERRPHAKSALDSIDRASLSIEEFGELSRAYVLLGFADAAVTAGAGFPENDPRRALGLSQSASAAANQGDYEAAVQLANESLRLKPGDPAATAVLRLAAGRGRWGEKVVPSGARSGQRTLTAAPPTMSPQAAVALSEPQKRRSLSSSRIPDLHMIDDETAAPAATITDRLVALVLPQQQRIEGDLRTMRRLLVGFQLPDETISLASSNHQAPRQFVSWMKSVPDADLASISYGIIAPGLLGVYQQRILRKGTVTLNHFIRESEPETRATVLLHELYHYWDIEVAGNPYSEPYNFKSPQAKARREYDAYVVAREFWRHARPGDASSPASKALDRIPDDSQELMRRVDELVLRRKDHQ